MDEEPHSARMEPFTHADGKEVEEEEERSTTMVEMIKPEEGAKQPSRGRSSRRSAKHAKDGTEDADRGHVERGEDMDADAKMGAAEHESGDKGGTRKAKGRRETALRSPDPGPRTGRRVHQMEKITEDRPLSIASGGGRAAAGSGASPGSGAPPGGGASGAKDRAKAVDNSSKFEERQKATAEVIMEIRDLDEEIEENFMEREISQAPKAALHDLLPTLDELTGAAEHAALRGTSDAVDLSILANTLIPYHLLAEEEEEDDGDQWTFESLSASLAQQLRAWDGADAADSSKPPPIAAP